MDNSSLLAVSVVLSPNLDERCFIVFLNIRTGSKQHEKP